MSYLLKLRLMSSHSDRKSEALVTAHEVACFAYCPEQWRLQYGLKIPPGNQKELQVGTRHHERKASVEQVAEPVNRPL